MNTRAADWIDKHLWSIIAAAGMAYAGFLTGTSNAAAQAAKLDAIEHRTLRIENRLSGRTNFMTCTVRSLDQVQERLKVQPPCPLGVPE